MEDLIREAFEYYSISYTPPIVEKFSFYLHELERWNRHVNLTAKGPVESIIYELLYDSLFLFNEIGGPSSALDMGSGSGILALPLAILDKAVRVFSVDKTLKKIQFQRHVKRSLGLENLSCVHGRIESLDPLHVDALLAKGFGSTEVILGKGGRHLMEKGAAYLLKGRAEKEVTYPGFSLVRVVRYRLPRSSKEYQLFVYKKVS